MCAGNNGLIVVGLGCSAVFVAVFAMGSSHRFRASGLAANNRRHRTDTVPKPLFDWFRMVGQGLLVNLLRGFVLLCVWVHRIAQVNVP